jgi:hypothetical protein
VFVVRRVCKYITSVKAPGPHTEALTWLAQTVNEVFSSTHIVRVYADTHITISMLCVSQQYHHYQ